MSLLRRHLPGCVSLAKMVSLGTPPVIAGVTLSGLQASLSPRGREPGTLRCLLSLAVLRPPAEGSSTDLVLSSSAPSWLPRLPGPWHNKVTIARRPENKHPSSQSSSKCLKNTGCFISADDTSGATECRNWSPGPGSLPAHRWEQCALSSPARSKPDPFDLTDGDTHLWYPSLLEVTEALHSLGAHGTAPCPLGHSQHSGR